MAEGPSMTAKRDIPELVAPRRVFKRKRRTGLLLTLKVLLPLIAVSCVGYIVYWSRQAQVIQPIDMLPQKDGMPQASSDMKVKQVQYNGVDANNRPFSITAESASQPQKSEPAPAPAANPDLDGDPVAAAPQPAPASDGATAESVINLQKPIADMTMADGAWVAVKADSGIYHRDAGTVDLSGNVTLFHDTGLSFATDAATVDLKNDWARGDQPVEGQNADGQLASQGFEVRDSGQTIVFTGRAWLKLFPKKAAPASGDSKGGGS
jgi:lipopolysaccharide export system protein LptC